MGNIFDYLLWRGDLDFNNSPFNEIDNLICSRISYFPMESVLKNNESITINDLYKKLIKYKDKFKKEEDIKLLKLLKESNRYKDLILKDFEYDTNIEEVKQFAAITIELPNNYLYISFRGTDNTFIGWKEDFNMTFRDKVPSQISALNYLNNIHVNIKNKLYVGGHSKGGNLAMFASINANPNIKRKIITIYNNDGPGFLENVTNSDDYKSIEDKIETFIPQTSIIGRLLNSCDEPQVIKSSEVLILQHDLFSWQMEGPKFKHLKNVDNNSDFIKEVMNDWLSKMTKEERENFTDILYNILASTKTTSFKELDKKWFTSMKDMLSTYKNLSTEDKKMVIKITEYLYKSIRETQKSKA